MEKRTIYRNAKDIVFLLDSKEFERLLPGSETKPEGFETRRKRE